MVPPKEGLAAGADAENAAMAALELPRLPAFPLEPSSGPRLHYHLRDRQAITWP